MKALFQERSRNIGSNSQKVSETLRNLVYSNTNEGREVRINRKTKMRRYTRMIR